MHDVDNNMDKATTILLVEDEVVIAMGKKILLEEQDYVFLHATNCESAIKAVHDHPEIDLVLMDMFLGAGPDGAETARLILTLRQIPIVFLTAYTDRRTIDSIRMIQHYGYVTKSSGDFVLLNAIETALGLFKARMEAKASEEKFRLAVENSLDVLIFADAEGRQFFVSPSAEKITGFTIEELLGPFDRVLHPDDVEKVQQAIIDAATHPERTIRVEYRHKHKDGSYRNIETIGRSYLHHPALHCIVASARDVTERLRTEENLRQTMHNLQRSQQVAHVGNWELDLSNNTITSSDEGMRIWGFEPGQTITFKEMATCIHPEDVSHANDKMQHALREKTGYTVDLRIYRHDTGELRYLTSIGEIICDADGKPVRIFGTNQDITERKIAENALAAEKERLTVTLRSIGEGVITTDTSGQILMMNETAEKMTGWTQETVINRPLEDAFRVLNETTGLALDNPAQQVLVTGQQLDLASNIMLQDRKGLKHSITLSASPIYDTRRVIIGVVVVFRDMSEKVKMLEMLQQSQRLESLGVLAGGIAHDFNNLLSGIFGYISLAREMADDCQSVTDNLDQALKVYTRATDLTRRLLTFSRGGAPVRRTVALEQLLRNATSFALSGANIACDYDIAKDLYLCECDENQIGQVVDNIVINAKQAMSEGGHLRIRAANVLIEENHPTLLPPGNYVEISITDSGPGISDEIKNRIFDPFFTTKSHGSGLGLATCYSIIQKHNGVIQVESSPDKGASFIFYLPASMKSRYSESEISSQFHRGEGTILLLDDEEFIRDVTGKILRMMGYSIIEAADGDEALSRLALATRSGEKVKALVLDLTIPGGRGGKEIISEIRANHPRLAVFASSGYSDDPVMAEPEVYGFTASIRKPYRVRDLAELFAEYL